MDKSAFERADEVIKQRRIDAIAKNETRRIEIEKNIPEVAEVNKQFANMGLKLLAILQGSDDVEKRLEKEKRENGQAQGMIRALLTQHNYPENYLDMEYVCPMCFDTGYCNGKRCECFRELVKKFSIEELNSSAQINLSTFESFKISYYGKYMYSMRCIYEYCRNYADYFHPSTSSSVLMYGGTGLGKTHLSLAIASEVLKKGYSVAYDSTINYLRQIENEHFGRDDAAKDTLGIILNADLLILDDLGAEHDSKFYVATIYNIINTRLNRSLPTIINTNLSHHDIENRYDARIASRIGTIFDYLKFMGTDIRYLKKNNKEIDIKELP